MLSFRFYSAVYIVCCTSKPKLAIYLASHVGSLCITFMLVLQLCLCQCVLFWSINITYLPPWLWIPKLDIKLHHLLSAASSSVASSLTSSPPSLLGVCPSSSIWFSSATYSELFLYLSANTQPALHNRLVLTCAIKTTTLITDSNLQYLISHSRVEIRGMQVLEFQDFYKFF